MKCNFSLLMSCYQYCSDVLYQHLLCSGDFVFRLKGIRRALVDVLASGNTQIYWLSAGLTNHATRVSP